MAETTKKAKAAKAEGAAKPKEAAKAVAQKTAAKKAGAKKAVAKKAAVKTPKAADGIVVVRSVSQEEVAVLAHRFWAERGYQHGHHHEDWLRAERELRGKAS